MHIPHAMTSVAITNMQAKDVLTSEQKGAAAGSKPAEPLVLRVRDLHVRLAGREVLRDVNLDLVRGDLMGLLGPNGAGKTTLLRSILGLIPKQQGTVEVAADPNAGSDSEMTTGRAARAHIGYVPQRHEFAWDYPISVYQCVLNGQAGKRGLLRRATVSDHRAVAEALERVHLTELSDRPIGQLSGGQRQRVLVARALANEPSLLLLDEPFTGMDFPSIELLCEVLEELCTTDGISVLMITHDLPQAVDVCHRIALLNGSIVASGVPAELRDPQPWTDTFGVRSDSPLLRSLGLEQPAGQRGPAASPQGSHSASKVEEKGAQA